ncbi:MAG: response regulator [Candidatus Omnitrophota bacterium]
MAGRNLALVIDDDKVVRDFLVRFLELKGMAAVAVATGQEAIEEIKKKAYSIVLIEVKMPGMDGLETLIELKKVNTGVKYVMMTGDYTDLRIKSAEREGALICMKKPFDIAELSQVIAEFI